MGRIEAPPSMTSRVVSDMGFYTAATIVTQAVTAVTAIVARRFLGPAPFGVWAFVQTLLMYADYSHLGTLTALSREIPFYRGKGDPAKVERIKNEVFSFSLLSSVSVSILTAAGAWVLRHRMSQTLLYCLVAGSALSVLQRLGAVLICAARADKRFSLAGKQAVYSAFVNALLVAWFAYRFGLYGFLWAMALSYIFNIAYLSKSGLFKFHFTRHFMELASLVAYGIPLMTVMFLGTLIETSGRLVVARYLGFEALGVYSVALLVFGYVNTVPNSISVVLIPNLQEKFGMREDKRDLKSYLQKGHSSFSTMMPLVIAAVWLAMPLLVNGLLPKYALGIGPLRVLVFGAYFVALAQISAQFVLTIRRHWTLIGLYAASCILMVASNWLAVVRWGTGLEGAALATVVAMFVHWTLLYGYAAYHGMEWRESISNYFVLLGKFIYLAAILYGTERWLGRPSGIESAAGAGLLFLASWTPFLWRTARRLGLVKRINFRKLGECA